MASVTISSVSYATDPQLWDELLSSDPMQYPLGLPLDQNYRRACSPSVSYQDLSMIAMVGRQPVAGLQITGRGAPGFQELDFYGRPAFLRQNGGINKSTRKESQRALAKALSGMYENLGVSSFQFLEMCDQGCLSDFSVCLLEEGFPAFPVYRQLIDLTASEEELRSAVRKSNKPHINWGEKSLSLSTYDDSNITPEIFEQFRQLHIAASSRETRPPGSWQLQFRQIMERRAFLIAGRLNGQLVTAALFLCSASYCYYGVSASVREMFDKPLSHAVLWRSVLEAKRRGCRLYEVGELVDLYPSGFSEKERNISEFKRGFGGTVRVRLKIEKRVGELL